MIDTFTCALERTPLGARIGVASAGLRALAHLSAFLGGRELVELGRAQVDGVIGWGDKPSGRTARTEAARRQVPFTLLEDGFIRSVGLGKAGAWPVSVVLDDRGMYYDARTPSRLEALLMSNAWLTADRLAAATSGLERWRDERLSKYNIGAEPLAREDRRRVVLVDQVVGDASIPGALATAATFATMLSAALATYGAGGIAIRSHPDVVAGKARGHLTLAARRLGVSVLDDGLSAHAVLDRAAAIWTVSSGLGFEAILRGVPVTTFAVPFYAGYGLSEDRADDPASLAALGRRGIKRSVRTLFAAAFLGYARYADPVTLKPLSLDRAMDRLIDWRRRVGELAHGKTICVGFSRWKQPIARAFLGGGTSPVVFAGKPSLRAVPGMANDAQRIAVWGVVDPPGYEARVRATGRTLVRVEDGFIRSVGLGSDLHAAGSLVLDDVGIYYDATRESRLERLIETGSFDPVLTVRAAALRVRLARHGTTKYNLGTAPIDVRALAHGRRVLLIAEQVPGDAALRLGSCAVTTNLALLEAVRAEHPDAFLVYKEHPDVVAGNRRGRLPLRRVRTFADLIVSEGDLSGFYGRIDGLHVISSLAGFEALCRDVPVTVWGRPFYAGWGLTADKAQFPRRTRRITLDELVAATLILYPRYIDPISAIPCSVEDFLSSVERQRAHGGPAARPATGLTRQLVRFKRWLIA